MKIAGYNENKWMELPMNMVTGGPSGSFPLRVGGREMMALPGAGSSAPRPPAPPLAPPLYGFTTICRIPPIVIGQGRGTLILSNYLPTFP